MTHYLMLVCSINCELATANAEGPFSHYDAWLFRVREEKHYEEA
jgi:hypothetical protein